MIATTLLLFTLALDTFAVALGLGLSRLPRHQWWRVGLTFACFEGLMPVVGLVVGHRLSNAVEAWAGYIAAGLLILVGIHAIKEAREDKDDEKQPPSVQGKQLFLTGLSVSLDELAVGFTLGILHVTLGPTLVYIGIQAFAVTFAGLALGTRLGEKLEERAELASGIVLILLGVALLISQATGLHFL